jgi:hypothetical protein
VGFIACHITIQNIILEKNYIINTENEINKKELTIKELLLKNTHQRNNIKINYETKTVTFNNVDCSIQN